MPFRNRRFHPRAPKMNVPKQPKAQPLPKPKTRDLRIILKGYISPDVTQRVNSLAYALQWYDKTLEYCIARKKVGTDQMKSLDRAVKSRKQGQSATILPEKETSLRTAVSLYEKVCVFVHPPPSSAFFKRYDEKKGALDQKQEALGDKFGNLINLLTTALAPKTPAGMPLQIVVTDAQKPFSFDPTITQVSYDKAEARKIKDKIRREGLLPAAIEEASRLCRAAAYEPAPDASGQYIINAKKMLASYHEIMQNFAKYCITPEAPKRLARRFFPGPVTGAQTSNGSSATSAPKISRPGPTRAGTGPKIAGMYLPNGAMAIVYTHLATNNAQWFEQSELQKLVTAEVNGRLKAMQRHGIENGSWRVEQQGSKWRLVLNTAPPTQQPAQAGATV